ncbi:MAG TPA: hypothetical protein VGL77_00085 [Armatimonadota bacterium]|jgi:hypothetical protein
MNTRTLAIGLALWAIDLFFVFFMMRSTPIAQHPLFKTVVITILIILLPVNLFVASRMPGAK